MYSLQYTLYRYTDLTIENFLPLYTFFEVVGLEELYAYSKRKYAELRTNLQKCPTTTSWGTFFYSVGHNWGTMKKVREQIYPLTLCFNGGRYKI